MTERKLGARPPTDDKHLRRYSLTADTMPTLPTPVVLGSDWYETWFEPYIDAQGHAWLCHPESDPDDWGPIVGGHAYCLNPVGVPYSRRWQRHYEQRRNDCTAYSASIMMSLLNRRTYLPEKIYDYTREHDEFPGNADEGTSVRATMDTLRDMGEVLKDGRWSPPDGIAANRWCRSVPQIAACLSPADQGAIILRRGYAIVRQSWGPDGYPYTVRVPNRVMQIVIFDSGWGDATLVTDR